MMRRDRLIMKHHRAGDVQCSD